jgi:penicillin-binding protein 2
VDAGDNVNLAVGQGDLQATPLQLADAYSAIANGGTVVAPHLGQADRGRRGPPARGDPQAAAAASTRPADRDAISSGLRGAATPGGGTSADVFRASRTRLRQDRHRRAPAEPDQSWYACYVDDPTRRSSSS